MDKETYNAIFKDRSLAEHEFGNTEGSLSYFEKQKINHDLKILDIGCNIGSLLAKLWQSGYREVWGVDISDEAVNYGKNKYAQISDRLLSYSGKKLPFQDEAFDVVTMWDSMEHIPELEIFLKQEVFRVLRPGGRLIFQTPNKPVNILFTKIQNRSLMADCRKEHCSLQTCFSLKKLLVNAGFGEIRIEKNQLDNDYNRKKLEKIFGRFSGTVISIAQLMPLCFFPNLFGRARKG